MPHAEKRDGKLTGFWSGEVDRRHKAGERWVTYATALRSAEATKGLCASGRSRWPQISRRFKHARRS